MERITLVNCVVLLTLGILIKDILTEDAETYVKKDDKSNNASPYMWFGPRVGKRKRNNIEEISLKNKNLPLEKEQLEVLLEMMQDSPWTIITINDGKRHLTSFTPRLGRESGEISEDDRWIDDPDFLELLSQRSPPFAPRLGRRLSYISPRLGTEYNKMTS